MRLEVRDVSVEIHGYRAVRSASLEVRDSEIVGVIGPNGSGKSSLLRTIYRTLKPTAGQILLNGEDVWQHAARWAAQRVAVVIQESTSDFTLPVWDVVMMGRGPHIDMLARETAKDREIAATALSQVGAAAFAERDFGSLSGGEKQRVLLARALTQQPALLVLDEPTNHLDIRHQVDLLELVRGLRITTLMTLHDLNLAATYCDRLYVLVGGQIHAAGVPAAVLTPSLVREVFDIDVVRLSHPISGKLLLAFYRGHDDSPREMELDQECASVQPTKVEFDVERDTPAWT